MPTLYDNFSQVKQYIDQEIPDMSSYVSKNELSNAGYITSIPNTYASYTGVYSYLESIGITRKENGASFIDLAYITDSELSGDIWINGVSTSQLPTYAAISEMGYISAVSDGYYNSLINLQGISKIAASDGLEIAAGDDFIYLNSQTFMNEVLLSYNVIPQVTNTYTLGDSTHIYAATYTNEIKWGTTRIYNDSNSVTFSVNNYGGMKVGQTHFSPRNGGHYTLGTTSSVWESTYTTNLYTNTAYLQDTSYSSSIVPKETNTYTLGDADHIYNNAYVTELVTCSNGNGFYNRSDRQINVKISGDWRYVFHQNSFGPAFNNQRDCGAYNTQWRSTYTSNIYADNAYISNYNNLIWTGTSAEYAALDNYTSYQIYMIKEA